MRSIAGLSILFALTLGLAACSGPSVAPPTTAPTSAPVVQPTSAPSAAPTVAPFARSTQPPVANPPDAAANDLGGAPWRWLQTVDSAGATTRVDNPDKFRVTFEAGTGMVAIATDCQSATGTYVVNGQALSIKLETTTGVVCPGNTLATSFIAALGAVESYSLDGGQLVLQLTGNAGSLRLSR